MNSPCYHIYTTDGYLISTFSCGKLSVNMIRSVQMFFSDRMLILLVSLRSYIHELIQYNEYTVIRHKLRNQKSVCFDCDRDYIYVSRTHLDHNYIDIYTHDFIIIRKLILHPISGLIFDLRVHNDSIFLLNESLFTSIVISDRESVTEIVQVSLESGKTTQTVNMYHDPHLYPKFISFHPLGHVIIGYSSTERLSILYHDEIVRYNDVTSVDHSFTVSYMATTLTGELVCTPYAGRCIRVYPAV